MSTFNFSSLQQKADQVIHNADEAIKKWVDFIQAPAGNVNFQYYDKNGNLQTVTFPNRNKVVNDFIANVSNALQKTFYVDSVHGDDGNDGSATTPFKSIRKAIYSVPVGGIGKIVLQNGQTHYMPTDGDIYITNKTIIIQSWNYDSTDPAYSTTNPAKIYISKKTDGSASKFVLVGSSAIGFGRWGYGVYIEDDPNIPINAPFIYCDADFSFGGGNVLGLKKISIAHSKIKLNKCTLASFADIISLRDIGLNFDTTDSAHVLMGVGYGTLRIEVSAGYLHNIDDSVDLGWGYLSNIISGIVRDANGVPRNVLSNIVL